MSSILSMTSLRRTARVAAVAAVALAASACSEDPAPPITVEGTGTISGQVFYDADNNGEFTPVGGDTLLRGVAVRLLERSDNDLIAQATTSDAGTFSFAGVPLGTHSLQVVRDTTVTGRLIFCVNPVPASVYRDENRFLAVPAKLGCVIPIAQAEALAQGAPITVTGIVTVAQGRFRGDNIVIQDLTGGTTVFGVGAANAFQEGDSIEVTGNLGQFGGEPQVVNPIFTTVKRGVGAVEARERTVAQTNTAGPFSADVGRLIVYRNVRVTGLTSATDRDGTISQTVDGTTSTIALRLDGNALTTIGVTAFDPTKCYDLTGILSNFSGSAQLKPRMPTDVVAVTCQ
jgi:DNA/RNA endonuclease YhcR with UshA esterase domain